MTKIFQFDLECKKKYIDVSLDIRTLSDIENFDRFKETPHSDPLCDLLWCKPSEDFHDVNDEQSDLKSNNVRSCAYFFV
jgi:diadenosine tetraphosphatase ApaH/serine/threonine PP2A family protein phosphatase